MIHFLVETHVKVYVIRSVLLLGWGCDNTKLFLFEEDPFLFQEKEDLRDRVCSSSILTKYTAESSCD